MRNFAGLLKIAGIVKKADPPHRGLNDDNPVKRHVYRKYGYIPQATDSYLGSTGDDAEESFFNSMGDAFSAAEKIQDASSRKAAVFDYIRAAGGVNNLFIPGTSNSPPAIVLGSYPYGNEMSFRHEMGHSLDKDMASEDRSDPRTMLLQEERAWDLGGIPKGSPIRDAALASYRGYVSGASHADLASTKTNYWNAIKPLYRHPDTWLPRYTNSSPMVVHDMPTARRAVDAGVKIPFTEE